MARIDPAGDRAAGFRRPAGVCAVTRGCGPNRDFPFPDPVQPSTLIYPMPLITASAELKAQGVSAISREGLSLAALRHQIAGTVWRVAAQRSIGGVAPRRCCCATAGSPKALRAISLRSRTACCCARPSQLMLSGITYDVVLELAATIYLLMK